MPSAVAAGPALLPFHGELQLHPQCGTGSGYPRCPPLQRLLCQAAGANATVPVPWSCRDGTWGRRAPAFRDGISAQQPPGPRYNRAAEGQAEGKDSSLEEQQPILLNK